jgi:hypothetical protein
VRVEETVLEVPAEPTHQGFTALRGYLILMTLTLGYHVLDIARVVRHLR